jgi:hypothetical protein
LILGLHVGEVGLGADVALRVKLVHLVIVADQRSCRFGKVQASDPIDGAGGGARTRPQLASPSEVVAMYIE